MFGCEPRVVVFHVGLECGIFAEKIPDLEAVSTCSSAFGVHTSKERLSIPSAQRFWPFLKQLLSRL
jgi:dipeptidase D